MPLTYYYFIFIALSALRLNFFLSLFAGLVAGIEYTALAFMLLGQSVNLIANTTFVSMGMHVSRGILIFAGGLATGFVALQIRRRILRSMQYLTEKNEIITYFGQHVPSSVVEEIIEHRGNIESEERFACVMFLDIREFTRFAEGKKPAEVVNYLNFLFDFMIEIINENNGIIYKFLGDGFMAVFGAPVNDGMECVHAVTASRKIIERTRAEAAAGRIPETELGIGLHAGIVMTGEVGSSLRREYTIIGEIVNLASRLEQLNRQFNTSLLVSDIVHASIEGMLDLIKTEDMGELDIRGHDHTVHVFRVD
jgi:adenylate cyclase